MLADIQGDGSLAAAQVQEQQPAMAGEVRGALQQSASLENPILGAAEVEAIRLVIGQVEQVDRA
jgi:hypothetical protein